MAIRIVSSVAVLIATATLIEHISGLELYIDTVFFNEEPNAAATTSPGRMGIPASISIISLGSALVLATFAQGRRAAATLGVVCLAIAGLSLSGYFYGASPLYSIPRLTGIALQTAAMIAAIAVGVIAIIREHGLSATLLRDDAGGTMFSRLVLPVVVIAFTIGFVRVVVQNAGLVDTASGTAARTLLEVVLLLTLLWWTAESLSRSEKETRDALKVRAENDTLKRIARAQESERRRIARDIHDQVGQSLTALRLRLDALQKKVGVTQEFAKDVTLACEQATKLDADVSILVWQMRPSVLDSHGLASALNSLVREWSMNHGIETDVHAPAGEKRLLPEIETNLYRIIQESLNNIVKHANATKVSISINYLPEEAVVVIEDNGTGFDADEERIHTTESGGYGLEGMKERAVLVGGRLEIESTPGGGTVVFIRVPRKGLPSTNGSSTQ